MSERRPQTLANHAKFDPLFHFFLAPVLLGCFIASIVFLFHGITALHIWLAVFSLAAFLLCASNPASMRSRYRTASFGSKSGSASRHSCRIP